jgi:pimeloyl-ACP methyl ester carboxylesterase
MAFPTFNTLTDQLGQLFQNKHYAEALDLITREGPRFPEDRLWADYWRMCAAARVENRSLVYQIAEQSLANGLWYGKVMWRQTPSFLPLQGDPDFERLVTASHAAEEQDTPSTAPVLLTRLPENYSPTSPLLIALHGNQSTAANTLPFWQAAVAQGWALALPQSTQAMFKGAYAWDDLEIAQAGVQTHFTQLQQQIAFDSTRVILAGHSMGGLVAIQIALTGALNVRGFVANGPAIPFMDTPEVLEALLAPARERGLRGSFIVGAQDEDILVDEIHALAAKLQSADIACNLEIVPATTHAYAPAYDAALLRALTFVAG